MQALTILPRCDLEYNHTLRPGHSKVLELGSFESPATGTNHDVNVVRSAQTSSPIQSRRIDGASRHLCRSSWRTRQLRVYRVVGLAGHVTRARQPTSFWRFGEYQWTYHSNCEQVLVHCYDLSVNAIDGFVPYGFLHTKPKPETGALPFEISLSIESKQLHVGDDDTFTGFRIGN